MKLAVTQFLFEHQVAKRMKAVTALFLWQLMNLVNSTQLTHNYLALCLSSIVMTRNLLVETLLIAFDS
jgi:hypothetical protein